MNKLPNDNPISPKALELQDILEKLVGHTVFVSTTEKNEGNLPMVMKGTLLSFTPEAVTFTDEHKNGKERTVKLSDITEFDAEDHFESIVELEKLHPTDKNSRWAKLLNLNVYCSYDIWLNQGILTHIGKDYVTIYVPDDNMYHYTLMATIKSIVPEK